MNDEDLAKILWNNIADKWTKWSTLSANKKKRIVSSVKNVRALLASPAPDILQEGKESWLLSNEIIEIPKGAD